MLAASLKALTSVAASCPVMASTTSSVSVGRTAAFTAASSAIMASSICSRPAVSTITASMPLCASHRWGIPLDLAQGWLR